MHAVQLAKAATWGFGMVVTDDCEETLARALFAPNKSTNRASACQLSAEVFLNSQLTYWYFETSCRKLGRPTLELCNHD